MCSSHYLSHISKDTLTYIYIYIIYTVYKYVGQYHNIMSLFVVIRVDPSSHRATFEVASRPS
jgi:hypothetical protein